MTGKLVPLYAEMVASGSHNFNGLSVLQHAKEIGGLITRYGARTAIDVGCGRGDPYREPTNLHKEWGLESIYLYDPAFETHNRLPEPPQRFDAVLCSDVLEHVPEAEVEAFIANLFRLADKFVWASVCCRPAKKTFPPEHTQNMHVTVRAFAWWRARFEYAQKQSDLFCGDGAIPFHLVETP